MEGKTMFRLEFGSRRGKPVGFTLIELMIVVAVVAILAAIAIPAYNDQVRRSRRADAMSALESMAMAQEQWRANNRRYATLAELGGSPVSDYYDFTVETATAADFLLRATSKGPQLQDTACPRLELNRRQVRTPPECWRR
jgi:type IV pilus assembly protein PilE